MNLGRLAIVSIALVIACGTSSSAPKQGACCPNAGSAGMCSASNLPSGGWDDDSTQCSTHKLNFADGCPTVAGVDSHGCPYVNTGGLSCPNPCGMVLRDGGPDAAPDGGAEAGGDAEAGTDAKAD